MKLYDAERMEPIKRAFEEDVLVLPDVEGRQMMGCPCYMAAGKMFATLMDDAVVITKLDEEDRERLARELGAGPFTHGQKVVRKWVRVPVEGEQDLGEVLPYVMRSYERARQEARG